MVLNQKHNTLVTNHQLFHLDLSKTIMNILVKTYTTCPRKLKENF